MWNSECVSVQSLDQRSFLAWTAGSVTMLTAIDKQNIKEGSTEIARNEKNKYNKLNVKYVFRAKKWRQSADRGFVTGFCNIDGERECATFTFS